MPSKTSKGNRDIMAGDGTPVDDFAVTYQTITIGGRKLAVYKQTFEMRLRRFTLMEAAQKNLNGNAVLPEDAGLEAIVRRSFSINIYPSLVACTIGHVFSEQDCYKIENNDLELWLETARKLNPDWFPVAVSPESKEAEQEKKDS